MSRDKIQDCADLIIEILTFDYIRVESKCNSAIEAMLIFLDKDDIVDILENRVRPHLLPKKAQLYHDYINNKIEFLKCEI